MEAGEFTGRVVQGPFARGSKSERQAVFIETGDGRYVLRRQGGNPLADPALDALVGKTIRCTAWLTEHTLIMSAWTVIG
jgi:hypothetical protein